MTLWIGLCKRSSTKVTINIKLNIIEPRYVYSTPTSTQDHLAEKTLDELDELEDEEEERILAEYKYII